MPLTITTASLLMLQIASPLPPPVNTLLSGNPPGPTQGEIVCLEHKQTRITYCETKEQWREFARSIEAKRARAAKHGAGKG